MSIVTVLIYCCRAKILLEVFNAHPEASIVSVYKVNFFFILIGPERRAIAPISFPFKSSPRVSYLYKPMFTYLLGINERVGMFGDKT